MKNSKTNYISVLLKLLSHHDDHEQYVGDVEELYNIHKERKGVFKANLYLMTQVVRSIPYFIQSSVYWGVAMLGNYLKIAFRNLLKYKLNSGINILGMAVALSVCFLILMFVQDELSYDQYHKNKERIYRVINNESLWQSPMEAKTFIQNFPEIEEAVRIHPRDGMQVEYENRKFLEDNIIYADEAFFRVFTFNFIAGDEVNSLSSLGKAVITEEIAKKYFGKTNPIGKRIEIENESEFVVTGVVEKMPHNSHIHYNIFLSIGDDIALWGEDWASNWGWQNFPTYVMLKPGTDPVQLSAKLTELVNDRRTLAPEDKSPNYSLKKITDIHLYPAEVKNPLEPQGDITYVVILASIAGFILLIACFNYTNILTANAATRLKEVGIKKVIGATRSQLTKQFFLEAAFQFLLAFVFSIGILFATLPFFNSFTMKELEFVDVFILENVLLVSLLLGGTLIIAGGYPARLLSSFQPALIVKGKMPSQGKSFSLRRVFVVLQYTISIILIILAIVMLRQIDYLYNADLGYEKEHIIMFEYDDNPDNPKYETLKQELLKNSWVTSVSSGSRLPSTDLGNRTFLKVQGAEKGMVMGIVHTDFNYFETFGIHSVQGRLFSEDTRTDINGGIILNESAVKAMGLTGDPVGMMLFEAWSKKVVSVLGVVPDFHFESLYNEIAPIVFVADPQFCSKMVVKINLNNLGQSIDKIKEAWSGVYPEKIFQYKFLDENYAVQYESDERTFQLMVYFTILAVVIASLGLFGMITHSTRSRVKEIGVRKVLGASVLTILRTITSEYLAWISLAFIVAAPVAYYALSNWLQNFAYRISISVLDFIIAAVLILSISFLTVIWQGIKASIANPVDALKYE